MERIKKIWQNKFLVTVIIIVTVIVGYYGYKKFNNTDNVTRYVLTTVTKGTIIASVSGTGQVSVSEQLDLKPQVSGEIAEILVKNGQSVKKGDVLFKLDDRDAQKAFRDAEISLNSAKNTLSKSLRGSRDEELAAANLQVESAKNGVENANQNLDSTKKKADTDIANLYGDAKNILQDAYNKVDDALNRQLDDMFLNGRTESPGLTFGSSNSQAANDARNLRVDSNRALEKLKLLLNNFPSNDYEAIDSTINQSIIQLTVVQNFLTRLTDVVNGGISLDASTLSNYKSAMATTRSNINNSLTSLNNQKQSILSQKTMNQTNIQTVTMKISDAEVILSQAQSSFALKKAGTDPLDIQSNRISVQQAENNLLNAKENLEDYTIVAPFDGIVADVPVKLGDPASSGTILATFITPELIAEITLNEIDAAKVKVGNQATLTFDAIEDLKITGSVTEVSTMGTVTQGVVDYTIKISFDTPDERVKPGMTVTANIITNAKQEVFLVPNNAVKESEGVYSVEIFSQPMPEDTTGQGISSETPPREQPVQVGLINDEYTEITFGLKEGDQVVTKTIASGNASSTSKQAPNIFSAAGGSKSRSGGGMGMPH